MGDDRFFDCEDLDLDKIRSSTHYLDLKLRDGGGAWFRLWSAELS